MKITANDFVLERILYALEVSGLPLDPSIAFGWHVASGWREVQNIAKLLHGTTFAISRFSL